MEEYQLTASKAFEYNTSLSVVYITSDQTPFFDRNDAMNHSKKLNNKTVMTAEKKQNGSHDIYEEKNYLIL